MLAAYTGSSYPLAKVTDSDDDCATGNGSKISFVVTSGTPYRLQVDGYSSSDTGSFTLSWQFTPLSATSLSISDASAVEGSRKHHTVKLVFTVTLSQPVNGKVLVHYATANGTALAGSDYIAKSGTLKIKKGHLAGTIVIKVRSDRLVEPNEILYGNLSNAVNAAILDGQGVGTIINDD